MGTRDVRALVEPHEVLTTISVVATIAIISPICNYFSLLATISIYSQLFQSIATTSVEVPEAALRAALVEGRLVCFLYYYYFYIAIVL